MGNRLAYLVKLTLTLVLASTPGIGNANDDIFEGWTAEKFIKVIPDEETIALAAGYLKVHEIENQNLKSSVALHAPEAFNTKLSDSMSVIAQRAASYFNLKTVKVYLFDERYKDWYRNQYVNMRDLNLKENVLSCTMKNVDMCAYADYAEKTNVVFLINSQFADNLPSFQYAIFHEIAHLYAFHLRGQDEDQHLPNCWMEEGIAVFLALSGTIDDAKFSDELRSRYILSTKEVFGDFDLNNLMKFYATNMRDKSAQSLGVCNSTNIGYSFGNLFFEYLYSKYSVQEINGFINELARSKSFETASNKYLKIGEDLLMREVFTYLNSQYKKATLP